MALVSVWCAVGALVAVFAAYFNVPLAAQLLLFIGVSIVTAAVVRPLAKKYADPYKVPTNADRLVGMEGRVTETVNNGYPTGAVYVDLDRPQRGRHGHPQGGTGGNCGHGGHQAHRSGKGGRPGSIREKGVHNVSTAAGERSGQIR